MKINGLCLTALTGSRTGINHASMRRIDNVYVIVDTPGVMKCNKNLIIIILQDIILPFFISIFI